MTDRVSDKLISHTASPASLEACKQKIIERIQAQGDKPYVTVARQLESLDQLCEFDFGCFLIKNQGINGYWTNYMLTHPWFGRQTGKNNRDQAFNETESFILNRAPILLATQQRFEIFLKENQKTIKNAATLACIPSGMMGELLYLDYTSIDNIRLIGIDYDFDAIKCAHSLAEARQLMGFTNLIQDDAWQIDFENEFDLISSNGLTIYEEDNNRVSKLFQRFHQALKPGGKLVTSFLTTPPHLTEDCEWDMSKINSDDLLLQKILFSDLVETKFQCYRSSEQTRQQLKAAGFQHIDFIYDTAKIFPTVIAYKDP